MQSLRQAWDEQETPVIQTRLTVSPTPLPKLPKHWSMTKANRVAPMARPETPSPAAKTDDVCEQSPGPGWYREQREKEAKVHAMDDMKKICKSDNKTTLKMLIDMHAKQGNLLDTICELQEEKELESAKILHVMTALHIKSADFEAEIHELKEQNHELKQKLDDMSESLKEKELEHAKMLHVTTVVLTKSSDLEAEIRELKEENEEFKQKLGIQSALWDDEICQLKDEKKELEQKLDDVSKSLEDNFTCSISGEIFRNPVVAQDGHTYERASIERWLTIKKTSPMTNQRMLHDTLIPNHTLKSAIDSHK